MRCILVGNKMESVMNIPDSSRDFIRRIKNGLLLLFSSKGDGPTVYNRTTYGGNSKHLQDNRGGLLKEKEKKTRRNNREIIDRVADSSSTRPLLRPGYYMALKRERVCSLMINESIWVERNAHSTENRAHINTGAQQSRQGFLQRKDLYDDDDDNQSFVLKFDAWVMKKEVAQRGELGGPLSGSLKSLGWKLLEYISGAVGSSSFVFDSILSLNCVLRGAISNDRLSRELGDLPTKMQMDRGSIKTLGAWVFNNNTKKLSNGTNAAKRRARRNASTSVRPIAEMWAET